MEHSERGCGLKVHGRGADTVDVRKLAPAALLCLAVALLGCSSSGRAASPADEPCASAAGCQSQMAKVAGGTILLPGAGSLHLVRGFTAPGPAKDNDGYVGKLWFQSGSTARSFLFAVYKPGQIAGGPSTCWSGGSGLLVDSPAGRTLCWSESPGGVYGVRYVVNGTIYEISGADGYRPTPAQRLADRAWAVGLVDGYHE